MTKSTTGYVYTLNDPRTGEPKYVGATQQPKKRFTDHRYGATSKKVSVWIDELKEEGLEPEMLLVKVTELDSLTEEEQHVISRLSEEWELLNSDYSRPYTVKNIDNPKVDKNLNLGLDVVEKLEEEDNQSRVVDELLVDHYGIER